MTGVAFADPATGTEGFPDGGLGQPEVTGPDAPMVDRSSERVRRLVLAAKLRLVQLLW